MKSTLILGYGNLDRQDDGAAWHIMRGVAEAIGRPLPLVPDEMPIPPDGPLPHFLFCLQLYPEFSELIGQYERVIFLDAHTGAVANDLNIQSIESAYQGSPLTHSMSPAACLALTQTLYHKNPETLLLSVRGYEFKFTQQLSPGTTALVQEAVKKIVHWMKEEPQP
ncbi:MAG TPA: hypothetical protein PKW33_01740 [Anaerolineaceae bacterium]|nr:hypothetical protein [Anaerolineaceae bacterium]HPN50280.1 hypothetical protein [Anaerolineaceae bacterium]